MYDYDDYDGDFEYGNEPTDDVDYYEGDPRRDPGRMMFADPGGNSALRASSARNPRNLPCPTCKEENRLTPADRRLGYQCNACADRDEGGGW